MPRSAGLLLYRPAPSAGGWEVLLVHPGGPIWARRDEGAWSLPKGEYDDGEDAFVAACREFVEETGAEVPGGEPLALGEIRQRGAKRVVAWALAGDLDPATTTGGSFVMEWPPRSGVTQEFPEVDRAEWFDLATARRKLLAAQVELLDRLETALDAR